MMVDLNYTGFITVRTSSTRLPGKCLLPFGEETVIGHVVKRAINYGIEPIICTSTDSSDDVLEEIANELSVRCFRGSMNNKLKRWFDCAEEFNIESFHTIDADDPFFDGSEMIESLNVLASGRYDVVCPTESSSAGGASVGYSLTREVIKKALTNLEDDTDTEMMWFYLEKLHGVKMTILPESRRQISGVRLTLDYQEDYWLLTSIARILGNSASRDAVNQLFLNNPDFSKINFFRNKEWKDAQLSKKIK
jgi:spore coat polysaccharide biosynthesis protein SpsF